MTKAGFALVFKINLKMEMMMQFSALINEEDICFFKTIGGGINLTFSVSQLGYSCLLECHLCGNAV